MDLHGKRIVVTGAGSGIGKALVNELLTFDTRIVAADRQVDSCAALADRVFPVRCDVSVGEELDRLFETALSLLGGIDIFFANAGFAYIEMIEKADWNHINQIYATNVFHPIYAAEKMKELHPNTPYKTVITCSGVAWIPLPFYALYSATKAALSVFAEAYRFEIGDKSALTLVYPIGTKTNLFEQNNRQAPMPWPTQTAQTVARAIIKGIGCNRKNIFPSKLFLLMLFLQRLFPFSTSIYQKIQRRILEPWLKNRTGT